MKFKEVAAKLGKLTTGLLIITLALSGCTNKTKQETPDKETQTESIAPENATPEDITSEELAASRLQDDFYNAINGEWIKASEIPGDKPVIGGFGDLSDDVEDTLIADLDKMLAEGKDTQDDELGNMLAFYKMAQDTEHRNEEGAAPIVTILEEIYAIPDLTQFNANLSEYTLSGLGVPFTPSVMADMKDAVNNALYLTSPTLGLPDKSYYEAGNEVGQQLLPIYEQMLTQLFALTGKSEEESLQMAKDAIAFETIVASYSKSAQESSVIKDMYNPVSMEELSGFSTNIDFTSYLSTLLGGTPDQIIVTNMDYFEHLDEVINEETFPLMKNYMAAQLLNATSNYLSEDFRVAGMTMAMIMSGQTEISDAEKSAFRNATALFDPILGDYYGRTYFGEDAKQDVMQMIENMIQVYKERLLTNDWLSETTTEQAIRKLDAITLKIGYPDQVPEIYSSFVVNSYDKGGSFFSNMMDFSRIASKDNLAKYDQPVDKTIWNMSADTVNALYSFTDNSICFPAAILQGSFYDLNRSASENYGAIGSVIAHEITHAFDSNGSQYDEYGNLNNWWTEEDYTKFEEKTNHMVDLFDGIEYAGGTVDGLLTVTENVADAGGVSCALEVVKGLSDGDLVAFFNSYATIWQMKATPEYEQLLLTTDVHAPNKLRTNIQVSNLEEFHETFDVNEGDQMYVAPEKRVSIW